MSEEQEITKSGGVIAILTMLSRVLGMVRDMVAARAFGASWIADAFFVAFSIPNMLRKLAGEGSLTISFIPVFTEELEKKGKSEAMKLAYSVFWVTLVALALITVVGIYISPWLMKIIAPGFEDGLGKMDLATIMTMEMFPYTLLICMVALAMGILNSFKHFTAPAASQILLNISCILAILIMNKRYEFWHPGSALVIGVLIGGVLQFLLQIPPLLKYGFYFKPYLDLRHPGLYKIARMMLPSVFAASIYQINVLVNTIFVSGFPGGRSWIYYADRLIELPLAIFGIAIATAILPNLSKYAARGDKENFGSLLNFGLNLVMFLIVPSLLGLILFREPILSLIYQRGEFNAQDTLNTARAMTFYALALWASAGARIMTQSFYAFQDAKTPALSAMAGMLINLLGCVFLTKIDRLGFAGVALANAIATVTNFSLLVYFFRTRHLKWNLAETGKSLLKCLLASVPLCAISIYVSRFEFWLESGHTLDKIIWALGAVGISALLYFLIAYLLRMKEMEPLIGIFRRKI